MSFFDWNSNFDIKVEQMNDEHKKLIALMNNVYVLNDKSSPRVEIIKSMDELKEYIKIHFANEEKYMSEVNYPKCETHKIIHKELLNSFEDHYKSYVNSAELLLPNSILMFFRDWLSAHISGIDKEYGSFANNENVN
ncbi:MAG: hemerythrin family protein [Halobacteriovoraceae bacterium]|nr:hemerythrin family protein [Halobacteriovoraceae bacterium]